jgi:cell division protein FtsB
MGLKKTWQAIPPALRNKYAIAILVFSVWVALFDQNSLLFRYKLSSRINKIEKQKEIYQQQIEMNKRKIEELQSSTENLEKFAREEYLMKKDDEVVFVIKEED